MYYSYRTKGTCSQQMNIETEGDTVVSVEIIGGCSGNGQGVSRLVQGMKIDEVINRLEGIRCGFKPTSCPDQLAQALKEIRRETENKNA